MIDPAVLSQYQNAKQNGGIFEVSYRGKIEVVGNDRVSFLHRMLTNDISALPMDAGCYAAFLTAQSKIITDMNVFVCDDHVLLTVEPEFTYKTIETLQKFVIVDDVGFQDKSKSISAFIIFGNRAESIASKLVSGAPLPQRLYSHRRISINRLLCRLIRIPFYGAKAWGFLVPSDHRDTFLNFISTIAGTESVTLIGSEVKEILRIEAGIPTCGIDFGSDHFLLETGIEPRAVSFTKGCYPGQELVARMDSRAKTARKLVLIKIGGQFVPKVGSQIWKEEKEIGKVTSACFSPLKNHVLAIATVTSSVSAKETKLEIESNGSTISAQVSNALS